MHQDTAAKMLLQEAARLRESARVLEKAAAVLNGRLAVREIASKPLSKPAVRRRRKGKRRKVGRRAEIQQTLREHGPLFRREVVEKSGVPKGSVATYLREDQGFTRQDDGRWTNSEGDQNGG